MPKMPKKPMPEPQGKAPKKKRNPKVGIMKALVKKGKSPKKPKGY